MSTGGYWHGTQLSLPTAISGHRGGANPTATRPPNGTGDLADTGRNTVTGSGTSSTSNGSVVAGSDRLMTIDEVAAYTQLPKNTLYKMRSQGRGPRAARLGKHLRYRKSDVDAWITSQLDEWPN